MENKDIIKAVIKCKLDMADRIINHLPEECRSGAQKTGRNLLKAIGEAVNEYLGEEKIKEGTNKLKTINVE